jgi:hypothetical protein
MGKFMESRYDSEIAHSDPEPGRDGFCSVPDFFEPPPEADSRDAMERVLTQSMALLFFPAFAVCAVCRNPPPLLGALGLLDAAIRRRRASAFVSAAN